VEQVTTLAGFPTFEEEIRVI